MCGLSLAWVTSENSTMLLESDSSWLTLAGPYPMLPRLSAPVCLVLTAPVRGSTPTSAVRLSAVQPPTALCWVASSTLIRVLLPLPDTARFHVQESFVWFRAKNRLVLLWRPTHIVLHICVSSIWTVFSAHACRGKSMISPFVTISKN